jgi:hypothetical protein
MARIVPTLALVVLENMCTMPVLIVRLVSTVTNKSVTNVLLPSTWIAKKGWLVKVAVLILFMDIVQRTCRV